MNQASPKGTRSGTRNAVAQTLFGASLRCRQRSAGALYAEWELIGTRIRAIIDEPVDDAEFGWLARTVGQAPEVDGVTYLAPESGLHPGEIVTVQIEDATEYDLVARVVRSDEA